MTETKAESIMDGTPQVGMAILQQQLALGMGAQKQMIEAVLWFARLNPFLRPFL